MLERTAGGPLQPFDTNPTQPPPSPRELEARFEKQQATQRYIEEFLRKREEWREHEREEMEEENQRILEFSRQQQDREQRRMDDRKQQEEAKALVQQQVC